MAFIKAQKIVYDESDRIISGSASVVDACAQDIVYTAFKSFRMLEFTTPVTVIPNSG